MSAASTITAPSSPAIRGDRATAVVVILVPPWVSPSCATPSRLASIRVGERSSDVDFFGLGQGVLEGLRSTFLRLEVLLVRRMHYEQ